MWSPLDSLTIRLKTPLWYFEDFLNPTFIEFSRVKLLIDTRCKPKTVTTLFNCPSVCPVFCGFLKKFFYFNVYLVFAGINQRNSFVINRLVMSYHQWGLGHGFVCYLLKKCSVILYKMSIEKHRTIMNLPRKIHVCPNYNLYNT